MVIRFTRAVCTHAVSQLRDGVRAASLTNATRLPVETNGPYITRSFGRSDFSEPIGIVVALFFKKDHAHLSIARFLSIVSLVVSPVLFKGDASSQSTPLDGGDLVSRGKYIVEDIMCVECHTRTETWPD